jgi:hypothetical protein
MVAILLQVPRAVNAGVILFPKHLRPFFLLPKAYKLKNTTK